MMATDIHRVLHVPAQPRGRVREAPPQKPVKPFYPGLESSTHASLGVVRGETPAPPPATIHLSVINGSNGKTVPLKLKSRDTIGKLKAEYLKLVPEMCDRLHLVWDGKPVLQDDQSLAELGVKPGATFLTYQRCTGG